MLTDSPPIKTPNVGAVIEVTEYTIAT